ncbi:MULTISPECIES: APC family permease [Actinomadura]|uniref:APC family permease n=1 Tax=Actinomadura yumaensis TaxID=111807 RepID=A0ABW2CFN9_9ACTN|nr:APC family permease [Actinomadura sp. J1-007]MWK34766.1 amino acid permease [Actinomadura sp. J1-007]
MTAGSVASLRTAPAMAAYGPASVLLYLVPAALFLLPVSLVSAELSSGWSGGVARWVARGISGPAGFVAVWCQFAMTVFFFPTLLAYVASTFAYLVDPALASDGPYVAAVILTVYWAGVYLASQGTRTVAGLSSAGLLVGTLVPGAALVALGAAFLGDGNAPAVRMDAADALPAWTGTAGLVLIAGAFLAYAGMEMNAVHVSSLRRPDRGYPKAVLLASALVPLILVVPALAVAWVVPAAELGLTTGVMQTFDAFFQRLDLGFLTPVLGVMLIAAALGAMLAWLAGPSKGLVAIGREQGYLPPFLTRFNKHGVQRNLLVAQGMATTPVALLYALVPEVSGAYWLLSALATQTYLIMYGLLFVAAARLRRREPGHRRGFRAPGLYALCALGLLASAAAFAAGFVAPSRLGGGDPLVYAGVVAGGTGAVGLLVPLLFLKLRRPGWKLDDAGAPEPA